MQHSNAESKAGSKERKVGEKLECDSIGTASVYLSSWLNLSLNKKVWEFEFRCSCCFSAHNFTTDVCIRLCSLLMYLHIRNYT